MRCHRSTRGIRFVFPGFFPFQGNRRAAGDTGFGVNRLNGCRFRKMFFKDHAVQIGFFAFGSVHRKAVFAVFEHFIADFGFGVVFQAVDPAVSDAVGELFFLSP